MTPVIDEQAIVFEDGAATDATMEFDRHRPESELIFTTK
jgi:hypothetical protein